MIPTEFVVIIIVLAIALIFVLSIKNVQLDTKAKVWQRLSEDWEKKHIELTTKYNNLEKHIPKIIAKIGLQDCKLLCYSKDLDDMGIENDEWLDYTFDWHDVTGVKVTHVDSKDYDVAVIYMYGMTFVIDIPFELAREKWKLLKKEVASGNPN